MKINQVRSFAISPLFYMSSIISVTFSSSTAAFFLAILFSADVIQILKCPVPLYFSALQVSIFRHKRVLQNIRSNFYILSTFHHLILCFLLMSKSFVLFVMKWHAAEKPYWGFIQHIWIVSIDRTSYKQKLLLPTPISSGGIGRGEGFFSPSELMLQL